MLNVPIITEYLFLVKISTTDDDAFIEFHSIYYVLRDEKKKIEFCSKDQRKMGSTTQNQLFVSFLFHCKNELL